MSREYFYRPWGCKTVPITSRPPGWRTFDYDGRRPAVDRSALMAVCDRLGLSWKTVEVRTPREVMP